MGMGLWGKGRKCKNIVREHPVTPSPSPKRHVQKDPCKNVVPRSPGVHITKKMPLKSTHCAEGMAERINIRDAVGTNIGRYYKCKECTFECATRAACVAHACREHTDKLIGPCDYCGNFYFFCWSVCSLQVINIFNNFSTIIIIKLLDYGSFSKWSNLTRYFK